MNLRDLMESERYREIIRQLEDRGITMAPDDGYHRLVVMNLLRERIKQRQFVLEGFRCRLQTEEEAVDWLHEQLGYRDELVAFLRAVLNEEILDTGEEYPAGEEPDDEDLPEDIETHGFVREGIALLSIELDLLRSHPQKLAEYYKRIRMPHAAKYAANMKRLYKQIVSGS